jgi:hypothetical protein
MKDTIKSMVLAGVGSVIAVSLVTQQAQANPYINGAISFSGTPAVNGSTLAVSTSFSVSDVFVTPGQEMGTSLGTAGYGFPKAGESVTFNGFKFNPPVATVIPLWIFTDAGETYSFSAMTVNAVFAGGQWIVYGTGTAFGTGTVDYLATPGNWTVNLSQSGASFAFDATTAAAGDPVPDGGLTVALLGGSLVGFCLIRRKLKF